MLAMFRRGLFYSFLTIYLRHYLGLSVTETTLFATGPMVMNVLFQTFTWGPLSDKWQLRRAFIIAGELLAAAGTLVVWYAHTLTDSHTIAGYVIIVGLSIVEIFWSMSNVGWSALISDLYPAQSRNAVQGRLSSVGGLGRIIGVWIGGLLYDGYGQAYAGWGFHQGALFFVAAGVMLLSVFPLLLLPEGGIASATSPSDSTEPVTGSSSTRIFIIFLIAMTFINFGRNSIAVIFPQYLILTDGFAVSSTTLSYIVNMQSAAIMFTGLLAGWISRHIGDGPALLSGTAVTIIALVVMALTSSLPIIYLCNFARGISEVLIYSSAYALASILIPPENRARLFGWFNATFFLSWGLAGTFIAGPAIDWLIISGARESFAYRVSFCLAALITVIGFGIEWLLVKQPPGPDQRNPRS
jgi:MFS family permease